MSSATGPDAFTGATPDNAIRDADRAGKSGGAMLAADGTPLKASLAKSLRAQKLRALALIAPLLIFIMVTFIAPIADMLFRSVENDIVSQTLPRTVVELDRWDGEGVPDEQTFRALGADLMVASELKNHTRLGSRLNYETTGVSSLFRQTGRDVDDLGEIYADQFIDLNEAWEEPSTWMSLMADPAWIENHEAWAAQEDEDETPEPRFRVSPTAQQALPRTARLFSQFATIIQTEDEDSPTEEEPWNIVYQALYEDLTGGYDAGAYGGDIQALLANAAEAAASFEQMNVRDFFVEEIDEDWADP